MQTFNPIRVIDARPSHGHDLIMAEVETGRNFVVIVAEDKDLDKPCQTLRCQREQFERLHKWGIHGLADVLELRDYRALMSQHCTASIYLMEQIHLGYNTPPRRKNFLLYCEARGIVSEHDTLEEAGEAILCYLESFNRAKLYPLAGIYQFHQGEWQRVKKLT